MNITATISTLAAEAADWFEHAQRGDSPDGDDGQETYTRLKDGRPDWVQNLVFAAHDDGAMFPDDWRYEVIWGAVEAIAESDDEDDQHVFADGQVDVYTTARFEWLASNLRRQSYVDDAAAEYGMDTSGIAAIIGLGQYAEALEVYGRVRAFLAGLLDSEERES